MPFLNIIQQCAVVYKTLSCCYIAAHNYNESSNINSCFFTCAGSRRQGFTHSCAYFHSHFFISLLINVNALLACARAAAVRGIKLVLFQLSWLCVYCVDLSFAFVCCCARGEIYLSRRLLVIWCDAKENGELRKSHFSLAIICRPVFSTRL